MKKTVLALTLAAALLLSACGSTPAAQPETPTAEPQTAEPQTAETESAAQSAEPEPVAQTAEPAVTRQDGERFDAVIVLEGMEETVRYEHIRNEALGFEMDYDYEMLLRRSDADRERFISVWDDPEAPENYLEVRYDTGNANLVADAMNATLSNEFDTIFSEISLDGAGSCLRIEASELKGTGTMPEQLQIITVIPAGSGCIVATEYFSIEASEGFGRRFSYMLNTLTVID